MKVIEEKTLKCGDCNYPMVNILLTETNDERVDKGDEPLKSKYRVFNCYKCGGSSFYSKTFEGTTHICPAKDFFDISIESTDIDPDGTIVSKVKVRSKNELR